MFEHTAYYVTVAYILHLAATSVCFSSFAPIQQLHYFPRSFTYYTNIHLSTMYMYMDSYVTVVNILNFTVIFF